MFSSPALPPSIAEQVKFLTDLVIVRIWFVRKCWPEGSPLGVECRVLTVEGAQPFKLDQCTRQGLSSVTRPASITPSSPDREPDVRYQYSYRRIGEPGIWNRIIESAFCDSGYRVCLTDRTVHSCSMSLSESVLMTVTLSSRTSSHSIGKRVPV